MAARSRLAVWCFIWVWYKASHDRNLQMKDATEMQHWVFTVPKMLQTSSLYNTRWVEWSPKLHSEQAATFRVPKGDDIQVFAPVV